MDYLCGAKAYDRGRFAFIQTYRQVLLLLQGRLLLPQPISQLADPFVHGGHLQVALVQVLPLLLQLRVLVLVELVPQLNKEKRANTTQLSALLLLPRCCSLSVATSAHLKLFVETIEFSHRALVVVKVIHLAIFEQFQLPVELLHLGGSHHQLPLLLLEQVVHLFYLLH